MPLPSNEDLVVWPDGEWCYREELNQMTYKSDDYEIVMIGTGVHQAITAGTRRTTMTPIQQRQAIERQVVRAAVDGLIDAGYVVSVFDGEEYPVKRSRDAEAIMKELFACDEEWLIAGRIDEEGKHHRVGSVYLVYGNDGWDVIADNACVLEPALAKASALSDELQLGRLPEGA